MIEVPKMILETMICFFIIIMIIPSLSIKPYKSNMVGFCLGFAFAINLILFSNKIMWGFLNIIYEFKLETYNEVPIMQISVWQTILTILNTFITFCLVFLFIFFAVVPSGRIFPIFLKTKERKEFSSILFKENLKNKGKLKVRNFKIMIIIVGIMLIASTLIITYFYAGAYSYGLTDILFQEKYWNSGKLYLIWTLISDLIVFIGLIMIWVFGMKQLKLILG